MPATGILDSFWFSALGDPPTFAGWRA